MTEFASIVAERWSVDAQLANEVCSHFEKHDTVPFLLDYHPEISAQLDSATLGAISDFLTSVADLVPKRKRVLNALKKANALTDVIENRVRLCTSGSELDDMLLPFRPNPRSRAQVAIRKGLGPLAEMVERQEVEDRSVEDLAEEYVGKDSSLKTVDDVIAGVKDILVEHFAYDETVRTMARAFGRDDGYIEVTVRNKKERDFLAYHGKMLPVGDVSAEEYFKLLAAEQKKQIRIKHGVQLFRITELLRHHFILNPDSTSFDLICEAIEECWSRLLQHLIEDSIKASMRTKAEDWALASIVEVLDKRIDAGEDAGSVLAVSVAKNKDCVVVAFGADGNLLGATREARPAAVSDGGSGRLRQFFTRYHPRRIVVFDNDQAEEARKIILRSVGESGEGIDIVVQASDERAQKLAKSSWMAKECAYLDDDMRAAFAIGLTCVQPLRIVARVGVEYFNLHPLQKHISGERIAQLLERKMTETALRRGISFLEVAESSLRNLPSVPAKLLEQMRKQGAKEKFAAKNDLLRVEGMTELVFRNIAGYIYFPNGDGFLDRTLVHPDHYKWVEDMGADLGISVESLINGPEQLRALQFDNFAEKVFIERKLIGQLAFGQSFLISTMNRARKRLQLSEVAEGSIVSGRVTNIAQFGVFVDINAVCDGLVHISQLADGYVETAEQVVGLGDQVNVRVMGIDRKKRRISLSMKGLGEKAPKVRPSRYQLSSLADHFKNR